MPPEAADRRLAAILSADVAGYSRLMAEDEAATIKTLGDYRDEIALLVRQHRGRVVDAPGDNLLAEFPAALDAVRAAVAIQRSIAVRNAELPAARRMQFRIGIHLGDVAVEGERVYGDGVNIAARLQSLAEPGGICISDMIQKQVRNKLDLAYEDLGEQQLKNIPEPIRAQRVRLEPEAPSATTSLPGMEELTVPGFGGRPAIAVLAFDNLSGDPEQEYFADGIAEDLITRLSAWRAFPVIARNSSFVYKGQAVDVKRVSRELGARYVVEGSVRRAGDRVRISAQLIDASTGQHVWAERYDRGLRDIFALQDEISETVAAAIYPELRRSEWKRVARREPQTLDAYEYAMRGWWHVNQLTKEDNAKARFFFQRAIESDPRSASPLAGLTWAQVHAMIFQWSDSPARSLAELTQAARRSVELNPDSPLAQIALSLACSMMGESKEMIAAAERAIELNPSNALAYAWLANALGSQGRAEEALEKVERGMRLSPQDPAMWYFFYALSNAHFAAGQYEAAVEWAERSLRANPKYPPTLALLAASRAQLHQCDAARRALAGLVRLQPKISIEALKQWNRASEASFLGRYLDGLRQAGLREE